MNYHDTDHVPIKILSETEDAETGETVKVVEVIRADVYGLGREINNFVLLRFSKGQASFEIEIKEHFQFASNAMILTMKRKPMNRDVLKQLKEKMATKFGHQENGAGRLTEVEVAD